MLMCRRIRSGVSGPAEWDRRHRFRQRPYVEGAMRVRMSIQMSEGIMDVTLTVSTSSSASESSSPSGLTRSMPDDVSSTAMDPRDCIGVSAHA